MKKKDTHWILKTIIISDLDDHSIIILFVSKKQQQQLKRIFINQKEKKN
jgi:hypothetical protein